MCHMHSPATSVHSSRLELTHLLRRPSGMLARSGSYNVRSRVIDDDKTVYGTCISPYEP